jgi:hypothetical protein
MNREISSNSARPLVAPKPIGPAACPLCLHSDGMGAHRNELTSMSGRALSLFENVRIGRD